MTCDDRRRSTVTITCAVVMLASPVDADRVRRASVDDAPVRSGMSRKVRKAKQGDAADKPRPLTRRQRARKARELRALGALIGELDQQVADLPEPEAPDDVTVDDDAPDAEPEPAPAPAFTEREPTQELHRKAEEPPKPVPPTPATKPQRFDHALSDRNAPPPGEGKLGWLERFKFSGYVQPQFYMESHGGASADGVTVKPDGTTTNLLFFRMRRAHIRAQFFPTESARFTVELNPFPSGGTLTEGGLPLGGTGTNARTVEAVWTPRLAKGVQAELSIGIFKIPFTFGIIEPVIDRPFVEANWGQVNMFPGNYDLGARARLDAFDRKLNVRAAVLNGLAIGEPNFAALPDPAKGKDYLLRLGWNFGAIEVGLAGYYGQGQTIDKQAPAIVTYARRAANVDLIVHDKLVPELGMTRLHGELTVGDNMDRGVVYGPGVGIPAIPAAGDPVREMKAVAVVARAEQDLGKWLVAAFRYDYYTPDAGVAHSGRHSYAGTGVVNLTRGVQLLQEVGYAVDTVHGEGAEARRARVTTLSTMLQAQF